MSQAIRSELSLLREIAHPGIVTILGYGNSDGGPRYAMEIIEGPTLRPLMRCSSAASVWDGDTVLTEGGPMVPGAQSPVLCRARSARTPRRFQVENDARKACSRRL